MEPGGEQLVQISPSQLLKSFGTVMLKLLTTLLVEIKYTVAFNSFHLGLNLKDLVAIHFQMTQ